MTSTADNSTTPTTHTEDEDLFCGFVEEAKKFPQMKEFLKKFKQAQSCACKSCDDPTKWQQQQLAELSNAQSAFWRHTFPMPGTNWTLTGHSRALERSGFCIEELKIFLDAGVGWKDTSTNPEAILVTHAHIDHINALPMLLRCVDSAMPACFIPLEHVNSAREMWRISLICKREDGLEGVGGPVDLTDEELFEKMRALGTGRFVW